jgi:hypothetical protein
MKSRWRRALRDVAIAGVGLAVGAGLYATVNDDGTDGPRVDSQESVRQLSLPRKSSADIAPAVAPPQPADLTEPRAALDAFLTAERKGDLMKSFASLSTPERDFYESVASWEVAHASMPEIEDFAIEAATIAGEHAQFAVSLSLRPRLDEVVGLVPARAEATYVVTRADDRWGVRLAESTLEPVYPADTGAAEAVEAWAKARQDCQATKEWRDGLFGIAAEQRAQELCGTSDAVRVGTPTTLDRAIGTESILAAFGPEASSWARVVRVEAPTPLDVVAAPVGDEWVVLGVVELSEAS